ncbi:MAG: energy-coupling factor transporter transmembrane protein EcfT [Spirochaetaceae bacterium]|nr:energy-coupling factor transporter transmembrane protein EcfT [Spirochaetaceae bacterium]
MGQFHKAGGGIDHLERLGRGGSPIHALHPAAKGLVTLGYIVAVVSVPPAHLSALVPFLLYPVLAASVSGTPWRPLFARLVPVLPFVLFFGLSNLVLMREPAFTLDSTMLDSAFIVTRGMVSFAAILLKTTFTVFAVLLLIATTPFYEIAACVTAPPAFRVLGLQIVLTMRYIATLLDEAESMWTAYTLRSPATKAVRMKDMGAFMGGLLLRSFDRAERVFCAMKCRGFSGVYRGIGGKRFTPANLAYVSLCTAAFVLLRLCNVSVLLGRLFF